MMREPLQYAGGSPLRLPPSELGSLSLVLTAIWLACVAMTLAAAALEAYVTFALLVVTAMAVMVFVPIGLFASLLAIAEKDQNRTTAYIAASLNGGLISIFVSAIVRLWL